MRRFRKVLGPKMYMPYIQVEPTIKEWGVWQSGVYKIARPLGLFQHDRLDRSTSETDINQWYREHPRDAAPLKCVTSAESGA